MPGILTLSDFLELATQAKRVNIFKELHADRLTPVSIMEALTDEMQDGAILESGIQNKDNGRFSFIALDKFASLQTRNHSTTYTIGMHTTHTSDAPFVALRSLLTEMHYAHKQNPESQMSNVIGFISYDSVRLFETIPDRHTDAAAPPEILFNIYRTILIFDHQQQKLIINMITEVSENPEKNYYSTLANIDTLIVKITAPHTKELRQTRACEPPLFESDINDNAFIKLVEKAKKYIVDGDIFQVVLSRPFKQTYKTHPFDVYRTLRRSSPSSYMFYLSLPDRVILGASPEKMVRLKEGEISINPIAGTRPRTPLTDDAKNAADLLSNEKELAEHMMLVDLARND